MKVTRCEIDGVLLFDLDAYGDDRGLFLETYQKDRYYKAGIKEDFIQDNRSISGKDVLRGLHYQISKPIGQLIYVARGSIFDVGVDLRKSSNTFCQHVSFRLNADDHRQLYLPPGVAHGFCTLSDKADILYKCTDYFDSDDEGGLLWCDSDLGIDWPIDHPIIHNRDSGFPVLKEIFNLPNI